MSFESFASRITIKPTVSPPPFNPGLHSLNRARLASALRAAGAPAGSLVLLAGGPSTTRHETDHEPLFRQESFFHWAFGVREPDFMGVVAVDDGSGTLFAPRLPPSYAVVMGRIKPPAEFAAAYGVERAAYVDELRAALRAGSGRLYLLRGRNTDSGATAAPAAVPAPGAGEPAELPLTEDYELLWPTITELRVIKTPAELAVLRYVGVVSSEAHIAVMQATAQGMVEYQLESLFHHWCQFNGGCRFLSYTCICASGVNSAVLHYGHAGEPNGRTLAPGDMCLFDMGGEFACYGADITTSFPVGGKFTPAQRVVYDAVLAAVYAVEDAMRPGVPWLDMQTLAYRVILAHLKAAGLVTGEVDDMMAANIGAVFMPHGLGHFLGIDTHDVGGYPAGTERPALAGYARLRTTRTLQAGMYITVEPGCYFIDPLLDEALADPARARFLCAGAIAPYRGTGGVRIEDDVLVTEAGIENFTWAPRLPEEVEAACAGKLSSIKQVTKRH